MRNTISAAILLAAACGAANGATLDFTYNVGNAPAEWYGSKLKETYDVAILISNPSYKGAAVKKISVPIAGDASDYSAVSGWLSTELTLENKVNKPDLASASGTIADGMLTVEFSEPVVLSGEPVYAGYSFTVSELTDASKQPVATVTGDNPDGFYVHSSRKNIKWKSLVYNFPGGAQSAMKVTLEGDFRDNAAGILAAGTAYVQKDEAATVPVTVINNGTSPVKEISYTWTAGEYSGHYAFKPWPEIPVLGSAQLDLPLGQTFGTTGKYPFTITVTKVNGTENVDAAATASATLRVASLIPANRPLVEEYTGMWCGACPWGYIMLETMYDAYGDNFIALAWHDGDNLSFTSDYPNNVTGFPTMFVNRTAEVYPTEILDVWLPARKKTVPMAVDVKVSFEDADRTLLRADADVTFIDDIASAGYRIGYALLADGLSNPKWSQSNYLSGSDGEEFEANRYFQMFKTAGSHIDGIEYNDVLVSFPDVRGIAGSLPAEISAEETISHSYTFNLQDVKNLAGEPIIQNVEKVRVVAVVFNEDGSVANCNTSTYADGQSRPDAVESVTSDKACVVESVWYDLAGRQVTHPAHGIYIRHDRMSDGSVKTAKTTLR